MKSYFVAATILLLASASPAAAQYSYSGSAGTLRTAPSKDKAVTPTRPSNPTPPNMAGAVNRTGSPQAAESRRTGEQPKPPSRVGTPLNNVPGQARPIPGMFR